MKKIMIIICVVLLVVSAGCASKNNSVRKTDVLDRIVIYNGIKLNNNSQEYLKYLETSKEVKVDSIPWKWDTSMHDLDGMMKIYSNTYKLTAKDRQDMLLPLNDILAANTVANDIPDGIMSAVTDEDGTIWALLLSHRFDTRSRAYNEEMMVQLQADIPGTIEEFKELLIMAKGLSGGDVIRVSEGACADMFFDVFAHFKCRVTNNRFTISWNEENQLFMDHAFTDEMIRSLQFIKELDDAKLIATGMGQENLVINAYGSGDVFTIALRDNTGLDERYSSNRFADSKINLEIGFENSFLYVVPIGTVEADRKVNDFINTFFGDEEINKSGRWGIDGKNYTYISPEFIGLPDVKSYYLPHISDCWLINFYIPLREGENKKDYEYWLENNWVEIRKDYYDGVYSVLSIDKSIDAYERNVDAYDIHGVFSRMLYKFIDEDLSIEDFLREYEKEMEKQGIDEYLTELNQRDE